MAGFLLTYVNHRRENDGLIFEESLRHTPIPIRHRWAAQIRETVERLHDAGLVWGDAHLGNVLIDKNNDAWLLIGYGGGYTRTPGWGWVGVDKELADTKEGDLQAVERIVECLSSGEEYESLSDWTDSDQDLLDIVGGD